MKEVYSLRKLLVAALLLALWQPLGLMAQNATISGHFFNPNGDGLDEVNLLVDIVGNDDPPTGSYLITTTSSGQYSVSLPVGVNYRITPLKDDFPLNGVTTYDLVLIGKHYNDIEYLNSPYKIIAADADHNNVINEADSIEFRKLILGIYSELPFNTSWRFVRADYVFPDPTDPFTPPFPESAVTGVLTGDIENLDFIGVKVGDVNGTAIADGGSIANPNLFYAANGWVRKDENGNCQADAAETALPNWTVTAHGPNGDFNASTFSDGHYFLFAEPGTYDLYLTAPNNLWSTCNDTITGFVVGGGSAVSTFDFAGQVAYNCPRMTVDLSAPFLRWCFDNTYYVSYCNEGTEPAEDAVVEVTFDPFLEVQSSDIPWTSVDGNTYTFPVGDVGVGECGNFNVVVHLNCDAQQGQSHCSTAHVYPDSLCVPNDPQWNGANLQVVGECQGGDVVFTVTNTGEDMTEPVEYIVIEDIMIQMVGGALLLDQNQSETITIPANGSTWRLEVQQAPYHPLNSLISAMVEGCGENNQGTVSLGIVPQFPTNDAGEFEDRDCQVNVSSFDPNDKQGFPLGVGAERYIPQGQEIEYLIRFQNTGTDTAFNIIVLDTLDQAFDLSTLRSGSSSHPCEWHLIGQNVLQVVFSNIMLPDSNVNEAASHGFFNFVIQPKAGLPNGTVIRNDAAIYFDFNLPVMTNETKHTVGEQFLSVSNVSFQPGFDLTVFPNPAATTATFSLKSASPGAGLLRLFDARGAEIRRQTFDRNLFDLDVSGVSPGMYYFRLDSAGGKTLASGKLLIHSKE
ncbi:MAG: T9SS type A sorting domain-containing protein [Saprospiraceae bacterium]